MDHQVHQDHIIYSESAKYTSCANYDALLDCTLRANVVLLATMNLQARINRYRERGFQQLEAEILVLIEESAAALFTAFPDQFILFGGATLVLFYESPRFSRDMDLLASPTQIPRPGEIGDVVRSSIQSIAETLGLGQLEFRKDIESPGSEGPLQHRSNQHRQKCLGEPDRQEGNCERSRKNRRNPKRELSAVSEM